MVFRAKIFPIFFRIWKKKNLNFKITIKSFHKLTMFSREQELNYAEHLVENINNDELLSLPISSMYRILSIYKEKNGIDIKEKDKIGSFLSRYFKIHGEGSVILFLIFNISNMDFNYFDIFLTDCSDDFNYESIQKLLIKTIIDLTDVVKSQKEQIKEINKNNKLLIDEINRIQSDQNKQIQQNSQNQTVKNNQYEKEINDLKKLIQEQSEQIKFLINEQKDLKSLSEQKITNLETNISSVKEKLNQYNVTINQNEAKIQKQNNEISDLKNNLSIQNNQISKMQISIYSNESKSIENNKSHQSDINDKLSRFIEEYDDKTKFKYRSKDDFEYFGQNTFDGIINYLSNKCHGNVHQKGIVNVTASSIHNSYMPHHIVDLKNYYNYFHSQNQPNSWIQYDFIDYKVRPTAYSIRTRHDYGRGHNQPKNWCIEGSNDKINWTVLDLQSDINFLDGTNKSHTFKIAKDLDEKECYRYLRYRLTGVETQGNYKLVLSALEFFGSLILI